MAKRPGNKLAVTETEVAPSQSPPDRKAVLDHLRKINDTFYDQIRLADQKAAYVFTIMIAFMITSADGRGVFSFARYVSGNPLAITVSALLALAFLVCLGAAILVVLPRKVPTSTSLFWGAWQKHRQELVDAHEKGDHEYLFKEYLGNADNLALIASAKYRFVSLSFRALLVAVLMYALLLASQ
jgi:hypothetical protein